MYSFYMFVFNLFHTCFHKFLHQALPTFMDKSVDQVSAATPEKKTITQMDTTPNSGASSANVFLTPKQEPTSPTTGKGILRPNVAAGMLAQPRPGITMRYGGGLCTDIGALLRQAIEQNTVGKAATHLHTKIYIENAKSVKHFI